MAVVALGWAPADAPCAMALVTGAPALVTATEVACAGVARAAAEDGAASVTWEVVGVWVCPATPIGRLT